MIGNILGALFPVFGLIALGAALGRFEVLGDRAFEVLNRFVITVTLPVLTFRTLARSEAADLASLSLVVAVLGGTFAIYGLGYALERRAGRPMAEANIAGLASCFSNTAFIGIPIALLALGPGSLGPSAVTMALHALVVFGAAVVLGEVARNGGGLRAGLGRAGLAMVRSPLIVLSVLGFVWALLKLPLSGPVDVLIATLAAATGPCALIAIGLFIVVPRQHAGAVPIARTVVLKLVVHPLVTYGLLLLLPPLPPIWSASLVLMAAMPSAASSFVLASSVNRSAMALTAWAVTASTCLAAVSLATVLVLIQP